MNTSQGFKMLIVYKSSYSFKSKFIADIKATKDKKFFKDCPGQGGPKILKVSFFLSLKSSTLDHSATASPKESCRDELELKSGYVIRTTCCITEFPEILALQHLGQMHFWGPNKTDLSNKLLH